MLTSRLAKLAATANIPLHYPASRTSPMPYSAASASTLAAVMNGTDSATAVSKPNDLSTNGILLSMLAGIAII